MPSAWFGLNTAVSALTAAQTALDTAAHNTANASTPGYSRQRVRLVASAPFTYPSFNQSGLPGQIGTGVTVAAIERVRDAFLDLQIRGQNQLSGLLGHAPRRARQGRDRLPGAVRLGPRRRPARSSGRPGRTSPPTRPRPRREPP